MRTPLFTLNPAEMLQQTMLKLLDVKSKLVEYEKHGELELIDDAKQIVATCLLNGTGLGFIRVVGLLYGYGKDFDTFTTTEGFIPYDHYCSLLEQDLVTYEIDECYCDAIKRLYFKDEMSFIKIYIEQDHASLVLTIYNDFKKEGL